MRDKRDFIARTLAEHQLVIASSTIMCRMCGKTDDEIDEQEDPIVCWAESAEIDSPYLIPPQVESARPIEAGEDIWVGDEWWPMSIKATEGER